MRVRCHNIVAITLDHTTKWSRRSANCPGPWTNPQEGSDMTKATRICPGFPGDPCDRPVSAKGRCTKHYQRYARRRRSGLTHEAALGPKVVPICAGFPGDPCEGLATIRGWCDKHYDRYKSRTRRGLSHEEALGPPARLGPSPAPPRECCVPGCTEPNYITGLCCLHYQRKRTHGTTDDRYRACRRCGKPVKQGQAGGPKLACQGTCSIAIYKEQIKAWDKTPEGRMSRADSHMRRRVVYSEPYSRLNIFERDGWTCRLCGGPLNRLAVYPDPLFASIDHIVPLSKGGHDTEANVQAAHLICNRRKGTQENALHAVLLA